MKIGSFSPSQAQTVLYAMAGDDCSLHHDLESLNSKQQTDHAENQMLTAALQVALVGLGKPEDEVALLTNFEEPEWQPLLAHYHEMFTRMGLDPVREGGLRFVPLDDYYERVADLSSGADLLNLYMVSGGNAVLHRSEEALAVSRNVNSKLHFARHAPDAGIPVPETHIFTREQIRRGEADAFFDRNPGGVMVKILGLAGARNVIAVSGRDECEAYIAEFDDSLEVLLQEQLDTNRFTEMTLDLTITPDDIRINNVRKLLFADGKWAGNYFGPENALNPAHTEVLLSVGDYARQQGHVQEEGTNCGIDYFVDGDDIVVTEINARWTGGLFPAEFLRQLDYDGPAIAFFDTVPLAEKEALQAFQRQSLPGVGDDLGFALVPMGFCPFPIGEPGQEIFVSWQLVLGDFQAFIDARDAQLSGSAFPTASEIARDMHAG